MKRAILIALLYSLLLGLQVDAFEEKLPLINGKKTVATVNNEPITLEEFNSTIAASHAQKSGEKEAGRIDFSGIMNRLINTRLILLEAKNMGLDELPEVKEMVQKYSLETLMTLLLEQHVADLKADENEVEKLYQRAVKEWKITSVRFEKEDAANQVQEALKSGENFEETVKKAMTEGLAKEVDWGNYLKNQDLTAPIARLVSEMETGSVSPVLSIGREGFLIFRLEGMRLPEKVDSEAKERAELDALNSKRVVAARAYYEELKRTYVKIDQELLQALDFESKEPGFEKLLQDKRVIAEILEEKPVTVGELTKGLKDRYFHGVEKAIKSKRINKQKRQELEDILQKRVLVKEALRQGIDQTDTYKDKVKKYEYSVVFGSFIQKVISPDIKVNEKELKKYYQENIEDYTSPQMMRMKSLVFRQKNFAVTAMNKLMNGADFDWLSSHAEGQVDKKRKGLMNLDGKLVTLTGLPEDLQKTLAGVRPGDFRVYESTEKVFYVLYIYHVIPPQPQPFEEQKKEIAKRVYNDKVKKAVEDYAAKLREYYPVTIYAKDLQ